MGEERVYTQADFDRYRKELADSMVLENVQRRLNEIEDHANMANNIKQTFVDRAVDLSRQMTDVSSSVSRMEVALDKHVAAPHLSVERLQRVDEIIHEHEVHEAVEEGKEQGKRRKRSTLQTLGTVIGIITGLVAALAAVLATVLHH